MGWCPAPGVAVDGEAVVVAAPHRAAGMVKRARRAWVYDCGDCWGSGAAAACCCGEEGRPRALVTHWMRRLSSVKPALRRRAPAEAMSSSMAVSFSSRRG